MKILDQIQLTLDEINALFDQIKKQPDQAKSIEIDLLKYKIVQLYDKALSLPASLKEEEVLKEVPVLIEKETVEITESVKQDEESIIEKTIQEETILETKTEEIVPAGEEVEMATEEVIEEKPEPRKEPEIKEEPAEEEIVEETVVEEVIEETLTIQTEIPIEEIPEEIIAEQIEKKELKQEFKADLFEDAQEQIKKKTVHEKFTRTETSINERIANSKSTGSVGESLQKGKISDIKSAISLNLKLSLIKDLYLGDQKEYKKMIDFFSKCKNYSEAKMYLSNEKENRKHWENKPELFETLMDLITRRFRMD